jgi:beta-phosphoglucomutase
LFWAQLLATGHYKGSMIQAVIFDFNGVLVDDEAVHFELFREVLAEEGVVMTDRDYHERYLGYDDRGCFAAALGDAGQAFDDERLDRLITRKARRYVEVADAGLRFFPFAAETLASIAVRWPVAICSGALRSEIEYALVRLNRRAQVAAIIAAEDAHNCKPDPAGYLQSLDALRTHLRATSPSTPGRVLEAHECLVVEDSLAGIVSAKGAGMWVVGITHTYKAPQLRQSGADAIIHALETLTPDWVDHHFACDPHTTW